MTDQHIITREELKSLNTTLEYLDDAIHSFIGNERHDIVAKQQLMIETTKIYKLAKGTIKQAWDRRVVMPGSDEVGGGDSGDS